MYVHKIQVKYHQILQCHSSFESYSSITVHWSITWESLRTTDTSVESIVAENFITTTELHEQITTHRHGLRFWTATVICYQASRFALQGRVGGSPGKEVAQTGSH